MFLDIPYRSDEDEIMDGKDYSVAELNQNFKEIETVNKWLDGYKSALFGVQKLVTIIRRQPASILDIGCGSGDILHYLFKSNIRGDRKISFCGIDNNEIPLERGRKKLPEEIKLKLGNAYSPPDGFDILTYNMMLHHFSEDSIVKILSSGMQVARIGIVITDLHRNWIAYYFIKWLGKFLKAGRLFQNDAPLSVKKGFTRGGILDIMKSLPNKYKYKIFWRPSFRYVIVIYHATKN